MSYLHKLRSGRTYGVKSQGSSESQDTLASTQHPLLLPPVLDTLFPNLAFDDLKNSRLVCSIWNAVGIPLIARRKLHPVEFSAIKSHQDFLDLKSELLKFPIKINFFQGFRLKWAEVNTMVWNNFLASFQPRALVISGKITDDPWTNLGHLLLPVFTTLTHLDLEIVGCRIISSCPPFTPLLYNLASLEGLTLKYLKIGKLRDTGDLPEPLHLPDQKQALEKLFQSQSPTLEELHLDLNWGISRPVNSQVHQIHLPIFPCLHTLEFNLQENAILPIFAPFNFNLIFPKLVQLTSLDSLLFQMKDEAILLTRGHPLKKLEIIWRYGLNEEANGQLIIALYSCFPNIEELVYTSRAPINLELGNGIEILWVDTLRTLKVFGNGEDFDFRHLKKLESLEYAFNENDQNNEFQTDGLIELLSDHFQQLPQLKSFRLSYHDMTQEKIDEIREGVPAEYRDFLTIDIY